MKFKSAIFVAKTCKYGIFVAKICKYGIFVAKIYKYAFNDSFLRFSGSLDSAASLAALFESRILRVYFLTVTYDHFVALLTLISES